MPTSHPALPKEGETLMSYDSKCYQLAREFLDDEPGLNTIENAKELAQDIQDAIEDFIDYARQKRK